MGFFNYSFIHVKDSCHFFSFTCPLNFKFFFFVYLTLVLRVTVDLSRFYAFQNIIGVFIYTLFYIHIPINNEIPSFIFFLSLLSLLQWGCWEGPSYQSISNNTGTRSWEVSSISPSNKTYMIVLSRGSR